MRVLLHVIGAILIWLGVCQAVFACRIANQEYWHLVTPSTKFTAVYYLGVPVSLGEAAIISSSAGVLLGTVGALLIVTGGRQHKGNPPQDRTRA